MKQALVMKPEDSVAVCIQDVEAGETVNTTLEKIVANQRIPMPHKIARKDILKNEPILKYSYIIGYATQHIRKGDWVHTHNMSPEKPDESG